MKNIDVVNEFVNGGTDAKTKTLYIVEHEFGTKLFNYDTCIAERTVVNGDFRGFKVNVTKYSKATTTIQNALLHNLRDNYKQHIKVAVNIPIGADSLWTV